ncbi:hypothetical protein ES703_29355 [subsurface metagenome]
MGGQGGGCALAVGSGNADYRGGAKLEKDAYLRRDKFVVPAGELEKLIIAGHRRIGYDNIGLFKISGVV